MAASSDGYLYFRTAAGQDLTTQVALASGATGSTGVVTVRNALSHIVVQRIRSVPTTYGVAADTLTFREGDATGTIIAVIGQPDTTGAGLNTPGEKSSFVDFGPKGWKMTVNKTLFLVRSSATGPGANVMIEAYGIASTGPLAIAVTN